MDKIFNTPFAQNGARVTIPEFGTENDRVSFDKGFTQPYEVEAPSVDNPAGQGYNILRPEMNEALNLLSNACNFLAENIDKWTALTTENLNNITQKGRYFQATQSQAINANNYPANETGYLIVFDSINGNISQFYKVANSNKIYIRFKNGANWSSWDRLILKSEFDDKISRLEQQTYSGQSYSVFIAEGQGTGERFLGQTYTNNTNRTITVVLSLNPNTTIPYKCFVNEIQIAEATENGALFSNVTFQVPPNATYKVTYSTRTDIYGIRYWSELR